MAKSLMIGQDIWGQTVWSVDDAWFSQDNAAATGLVDFYCSGSLGLEMTDFVGQPATTFSRMSQALERLLSISDSGTESRFMGDFPVLSELVSQCENHRVRLALCDFEYFEKHFRQIDRQTSAVLLDVHNAHLDDNSHGVVLLHKLLEGRRFKGDIFFFTARKEETLERIEANATDDTWWPLRYVPLVVKGDPSGGEAAFSRDLAAFLRYFRQGDHREPLRFLLDSAIRAQEFPHPSDGQLETLLDFFPLQAEHVRAGAESFKALYYDDPASKKGTGVGTREIKPNFLRELLAYAGVELTCAPSVSTNLRLPASPGVLFIFNLVRFCHSFDSPDSRKVSLKTERLAQPRREKATLTLCVPDARALEAAWMLDRGGGTSTSCFRDLLGCSEEALTTLCRTEAEKSIVRSWANESRLGRRSSVPLVRIRPRFSDENTCVAIEWEFAY
jgi:hypothetical protein